mgnify:FL=1
MKKDQSAGKTRKTGLCMEYFRDGTLSSVITGDRVVAPCAIASTEETNQNASTRLRCKARSRAVESNQILSKGESDMTDKEQARKNLAKMHYELEPGITQIHGVFSSGAIESRPAEPIKLLEVNKHTIACGITPLGFDPMPASGMYPSVIIEVTPAEYEKIKGKELPLPHGWTLGPKLPRSAPVGAN